jgi:hypothetical protein
MAVKEFDSEEEMFEYVNSPEFMAPFNTYTAQVHALCTEGLSEESKKLYFDWHEGRYKPSSEEQERSYQENRPLHDAIRASISWGLG